MKPFSAKYKKRLSSVLTYIYSSTIYSKTQAFEMFSLHFLDKMEYKVIVIYIDIAIPDQRSSPCGDLQEPT